MTSPIGGMFLRPFKQRENRKKLAITSPRSIREESYVSIGGIDQWVTVRGQDRDNPILLLIHGGPGSPYTPFNPLLGEWEKQFTVVQWDQRGSGKTFIKNNKNTSAPLTFDMLASDGIELTGYILQRLGKRRLLLVASSAGSYVGLIMAKRRPDSFIAYVGTDQNSPGGWELSYELTLQAAQKANDKKGLQVIAGIPSNPVSWTSKQHLALNKVAIKDTKNVPNMINDIVLPALLFSPDYKMKDIAAIDKGMRYMSDQLFEAMKTFDFEALGYDFKLPFFVLQGAEDIVTPVASARVYVNLITAPQKGFVTIGKAGHIAAFCHPHEFLQQIIRIHESTVR